MATPTRKQLDAARAKAEAANKNAIYDALEQVEDAKGVMKLGDVLRDTAKTLTSKKIGKMWSELIQGSNPNEKRVFLKQFIEALVVFEKTHADNQDTQVSRLTDEQINAMLESDYGLKPRQPGTGLPEAAGELEAEILGQAGGAEEGADPPYEESEIPEEGQA